MPLRSFDKKRCGCQRFPFVVFPASNYHVNIVPTRSEQRYVKTNLDCTQTSSDRLWIMILWLNYTIDSVTSWWELTLELVNNWISRDMKVKWIDYTNSETKTYSSAGLLVSVAWGLSVGALCTWGVIQIMSHFPHCFTLGEATVVTHGIVLFLLSVFTNLPLRYHLPPIHDNDIITVILQVRYRPFQVVALLLFVLFWTIMLCFFNRFLGGHFVYWHSVYFNSQGPKVTRTDQFLSHICWVTCLCDYSSLAYFAWSEPPSLDYFVCV